ncbi:hypothetical protein F4802DRAFT_540829 [Xylaria palmicola]|nr:hypothetical protein F4802DRAFT_540829 [Xylaria palmicola]
MARMPTRSQARASTISPAQAGVSRATTRSACDRCHQQKLRCIKTSGGGGCERCARSGRECRYGPRERRSARHRPLDAWAEPRGLAPVAVPSLPNARQVTTEVPDGLECDWTSFLCTGMDDIEGPGQPLIAPVVGCCRSTQLVEPFYTYTGDYDNEETYPAVHALDSYETTRDYHSYPSRGLGCSLASTTAGRLTSLSVALYECASKLPSIKPPSAKSTGPDNASRVVGTRREEALLALDEVFHVTHEFIDIIENPPSIPRRRRETPTLADACLAPYPPPLPQGDMTAFFPSYVAPQMLFCNAETPTGRDDAGGGGRGISGAWEPPPPPAPTTAGRADDDDGPPHHHHLDEASALLLLSCHYRLAEIYGSIFEAIRRCADGSSAAEASRRPAAGVILPRLRVGGVGSPALRVDTTAAACPRLPRATVSMYMALVTTLSAQLWARLGAALRSGGARGAVGDGDGDPVGRRRRGGVADLAWDDAVTRTDEMSRTIEAVQNLL